MQMTVLLLISKKKIGSRSLYKHKRTYKKLLQAGTFSKKSNQPGGAFFVKI